jgi:hypothetical protein
MCWLSRTKASPVAPTAITRAPTPIDPRHCNAIPLRPRSCALTARSGRMGPTIRRARSRAHRRRHPARPRAKPATQARRDKPSRCDGATVPIRPEHVPHAGSSTGKQRHAGILSLR